MKVLSFDKRKLALDKASKRIEDTTNGFLRVRDNPFTREQVVQYRGYEIPEWQEHGLERDKLYNVYRPAKELSRKETVESLNGIPLLLEHETFDPDNPPIRRQIGSAGTDAKWVPPYLTNSLTFTSTKAINMLKSGAMKELSLGYYYDPVFKSGTAPDGKPYDVMMTNIIANHIALVEEGRAGPDVAVHDSKPKSLRGKLTMDQNQLDALKQAMEQGMSAFIQSTLSAFAAATESSVSGAADEDEQACDEDEAVVDPTAPENSEAPETEDEDEEQAQDDADEGATEDEDEDATEDEDEEQAQDEDATEDEDEEQAQDDDEDYSEALAEAGLANASDEVKAAFIAGMKKSSNTAKAVAQDSKRSRSIVSKALSLQIKSAVKQAVADARAKDKAKVKAANEVRAVLGAVDAMAYDSASAIYKAALGKMGYTKTELKRMTAAESRAYFCGTKRGGAARKATIAADSKRRAVKSDEGFSKLDSMYL